MRRCRGSPARHQSGSSSPCSRIHSSVNAPRSHPDPLDPQKLQSFCTRALVVVDDGVKVERVDLARVELLEALTNALGEDPELLLVIAADHLPRRPASRFVSFDIPDTSGVVHERKRTADGTS